MDMLDKTVTLLKRVKGSWPRIAEEADVSVEWIKDVVYGRTKDPSIKRVTRVHDVLVGKDLVDD